MHRLALDEATSLLMSWGMVLEARRRLKGLGAGFWRDEDRVMRQRELRLSSE